LTKTLLREFQRRVGLPQTSLRGTAVGRNHQRRAPVFERLDLLRQLFHVLPVLLHFEPGFRPLGEQPLIAFVDLLRVRQFKARLFQAALDLGEIRRPTAFGKRFHLRMDLVDARLRRHALLVDLGGIQPHQLRSHGHVLSAVDQDLLHRAGALGPCDRPHLRFHFAVGGNRTRDALARHTRERNLRRLLLPLIDLPARHHHGDQHQQPDPQADPHCGGLAQ
jgi:hypothetical protein